MSVAALSLVALLAASPADEEESRRAEEAAFVAIKEQRWCDAARDFVRADMLAPADELVFNAALAAERAGDVAAARALFGRVPAASAQAQAARRHLDELARAEQTGACALDDAVTAPPMTASGPPSGATPPAAAPTGDAGEDTDDARETTRVRAAPNAADGTGAAQGPPLLALGAAGVLVLGGAVAVVLGSGPWFAHEEARNAILAAEAAGATPASVADEHARQRDARAAWESGGAVAVGAGCTAMVLGTAGALVVLLWGSE